MHAKNSVLVITSDPTTHTLLSDRLGREGVVPLAAATSESARELFLRHRATLRVVVTDTVLIDPHVAMPALVRMMNAHEPQIEYIAYSNYSRDANDELMKAGCGRWFGSGDARQVVDDIMTILNPTP